MVGPALNPPDAVALALDSRRMLQILHLHGIPALDREKHRELIRQLRTYHILLFQQRILQIARSEETAIWLSHPLDQEQKYEMVEINLADPEVKLVIHYAVRSLYALGLDYGVVTISAFSPRRVRVINIDPLSTAEHPHLKCFPELTSKLTNEKNQFNQYAELEQQRSIQIMLGADPEFALRDAKGKMVLASNYLGKYGTVGCDFVRYREELAMNQWPLVEVRPEPSTNPEEMFTRIYHSLQEADEKIDHTNLEWIAGGMPFDGYSTGGHIHFSGSWLHFQLIRKLDNYLALPLVLIEDESCRKRRPRYGFLGDFREKAHGGFEYRTLPSWLVSPVITKGIFYLAKLVASFHWKLQANPLADWRVQKAYYRGEKAKLEPIVRQLWQELTLLPQYQQYGGALNPLFAALLSGKEWQADKDIRIAWNVRRDSATLEHTPSNP